MVRNLRAARIPAGLPLPIFVYIKTVKGKESGGGGKEEKGERLVSWNVGERQGSNDKVERGKEGWTFY